MREDHLIVDLFTSLTFNNKYTVRESISKLEIVESIIDFLSI